VISTNNDSTSITFTNSTHLFLVHFGHGIVAETAMSLSHGCIQMITNLYADTGVCNKMKHAVWAQQLHKVDNKASYKLHTVW